MRGGRAGRGAGRGQSTTRGTREALGDGERGVREVSASEASAGGRAGHEKRREACGMGAVRKVSVGDGSGERCGADRCAGGCVTAAAGRQKERSFPEQSPPAAFGGVPDASLCGYGTGRRAAPFSQGEHGTLGLRMRKGPGEGAFCRLLLAEACYEVLCLSRNARTIGVVNMRRL